MVGRAIPLLVDIFMTALAGVRFHEELAGNFFASIDLRRTGEKRAGGAIAFAIHGEGGKRGILEAGVLAPASFAEIGSRWRERGQQRDNDYDAQSSMT